MMGEAIQYQKGIDRIKLANLLANKSRYMLMLSMKSSKMRSMVGIYNDRMTARDWRWGRKMK